MSFSGSQRLFGALLLVLLLFVSACGSQPTRWDEAEKTQGPATSAESVEGGSLNTFFPKDAAESEGFDFTFTQEKDGFAEASLEQDGTEVALLSISDTTNNPEAAEKFAESTREIGGYPAIDVDFETAVLVGDRFQVKAFSVEDSFTEADRDTWIEKFDLAGLEGLTE
ncbi:MAG: hypothetical protein HC837_11590 [Chloroflexaceae bacterium]|nr:hypothetical protein [Chloroflexaceae bacterium]